jgi:hypothetical protein
MTTNLSAVTLLHNVDAIKYPWKQCIESAYPVVDRHVLVVAPPNEDDTEDQVLALATMFPEQIVVVTGSKNLWKQLIGNGVGAYYFEDAVWPTNHNGLSGLVNVGFTMACERPDEWVFQLQADEILDEADYPELLRLPLLPEKFKAASWRFRHYCGDFHHIHPFMYAAADFPAQPPQRIVRAVRYDSDWVNVGDAVQCQGTGEIYESSVIVHHCGKVHVGRSKEAAKKEYDFQTQLYVGHAFSEADPRVVKAYQGNGINYFDIGTDVREFAGPWPKWVKDYARELGEEL